MKYVFASAVMGTILFLSPHSSRTSTTLALITVGSIVYLAVLMMIDKEARTLPKAYCKRLKGRKA